MRGRESKVKEKKQRNAFTSTNNPFASSSGWAGWPPTSNQLLNTSISSSSWVLGLAFPSSSSDSSEEESYEEKEAVQTDTNMNLISKLIKKKEEEIISYLYHCHLTSHPPALPPSPP